ncbi:MAG: MBL fold metallo-hydrolase [Leucobacter sp.]
MTSPFHLTLLGHSCVLVETAGGSKRPSRILLDPGTLTPPLEPIPDLDAVLVTHAHPDHLDPEQLARLFAGGPVPVYGDAAVAAAVSAADLGDATVLAEGVHRIAGVELAVASAPHEEIYRGVPLPGNLTFRIADRLFAPGDAFAVPEEPVDVLLLQTGAPWMKLAETIDYLRAVAPRIAVPVHDGGLAAPHREMHRGLMQKFAPEGTTVIRPEIGERIEI